MNDKYIPNMAKFMASAKQAKARDEQLECMAEREADEYFDSSERGENTEWAQYDTDESADALQAIWNVLNRKEEPLERVALAREICRGVMRHAANIHGGQVVANRNSLKMSANQIMRNFDSAINGLKGTK
mgnify:CR=1 FL=1